MQLPVRLGLIGVGGVGQHHLAAISILEQEGLIKLVAIADPCPMADSLREEFTQRNIRMHSDYRSLIAEDIDAVTIATPIHLHYRMAEDCIRRGLLILLEKPPVPLGGQLESLIELDRDRRVFVGFQMIHNPPAQQVKRLICSGKLGAIRDICVSACWPRGDRYYGRAKWAGQMLLGQDPVFDGPATNGLAHVLHHAMYFASNEPSGFAIPEEVTGELYRVRKFNGYDLICLSAFFNNGIRMTAALTHACKDPLPFSVKVIGTKGWAQVCETEVNAVSNVEPLPDIDEGYAKEPSEPCLLQMYRDVIASMRGEKGRPRTRLVDARGYVRTTNAALLSSGIHEVSPEYIQSCPEHHAGEPVGTRKRYFIPGIEAAVQQCAASGKLFSELGLPWATAGKVSHTEEAARLSIEQFKMLATGRESLVGGIH